MKNLVLISIFIGMLPLNIMAQEEDDLYFIPKSSATTGRISSTVTRQTSTYYCGSNRNVDEYNRRGNLRSSYQNVGTDSLGNDIIDFNTGNAIYPDSSFVENNYSDNYYEPDDYLYSRRINYYDGLYNPWLYDINAYPYWEFGYGWYSPFAYGYYGWSSPWFYDSWYGSRYYYGWDYGYYGPIGGNVVVTRPANSRPGGYGQPTHVFNGTNGNSRSTAYNRSSYNRSTAKTYSNKTSSESNERFGGLRNSNTNSNIPTRSYSPTPSSSSSSSFGGSFGGSRSSGGGSFGGGASSGGGSHFGGRR